VSQTNLLGSWWQLIRIVGTRPVSIFMKLLFIPGRGLHDVIEDWLTPGVGETNWLFVTLDSARGEHLKLPREYLTPQLQREGIDFWWEEEGLWFPGSELTKDFVFSQIVVNFSAAYIFPSSVKRCAKPQFSETTDRGEFSDVQSKAVTREIDKLKAKACVADGCGLQCVFADEALHAEMRKRRPTGNRIDDRLD
jgi:hypothetical protein